MQSIAVGYTTRSCYGGRNWSCGYYGGYFGRDYNRLTFCDETITAAADAFLLP